MGLESIGLSFSWMFHSTSKSSSSSSDSTSRSTSDGKKSKKHIRSRAEQQQLAQNGSAAHHGDDHYDEGHYPGLVNISGTYCFMNSTLQALASLTYLQPHIDAINAKAEALDVPTPVIDALKDLFRRLNKSHSSYHAIRPTDIIQALSSQTEGRTNSLFYSREHQDAQELFQVVSECIKNEITAVDKEAYRDRGLGGLPNVPPPETMRDIGKSVFDGLTANRRSCCVCGYTEAVMHFALDNWQLAVPRMAAVCRLEDCLEDYTRLEVLKDCICRKCSIIATHKRLQQDLLKLEHEITLSASSSSGKKPSNSKKERLKKVRKMELRVRQAIEEERIEDDLKDIRMEKMFSPASTKQAMIARPPPVLALHINRSMHYGHYASKNTVRLLFPEVLDLTPYTTSGSLSTVPTSAISTPPPPAHHPRSTTPTPATYANPRVIYRLAAVVCHFGQHSFGHYICYRRKPKHASIGFESRWEPPRMIDPLMWEDLSHSTTSASSSTAANAGENADDSTETPRTPRYIFADTKDGPRPGKGWLRISDDSVRECGIETVLQEGAGAFMLYYERAVLELPGPYSARRHQGAGGVGVGGGEEGSPRSSEETLKPEMKTVELNGSVASLVSEVGVGVRPHQHRHRHHSRSCSRSQERERSAGKEEAALRMNGDARNSRPAASTPITIPTPIVAPTPKAVGLSASLSHSQFLGTHGARIVRNVTTTRGRSGSVASRSLSRSVEGTPTPPASTPVPPAVVDEFGVMVNGHADTSVKKATSPPVTMNGHGKVNGNGKVNGMAHGHHRDMSASMPSTSSSSSPHSHPSKLKPKAPLSSSSSPSKRQNGQAPLPLPPSPPSPPPPQRIHSPKPHHPPNGIPVVDLKA